MSNSIPIVLVVEDDMILRYLAERQLLKLGYLCELVENGADALKKMKEGRFDLIFMDIQMPVMNGLESTSAIRKMEHERGDEKSTPIVAMTANPNQQQCFEAGMDDFMFKPVSLESVKAMCHKWLGTTA
jgi:CheY-like chemotaxis protein